MRLSSIVSLVVVTASLALGGCAADAEPTSGGSQPNVALSDPNATANDQGRANDIAKTNKVSDQYANPADEAKAHGVLHYNGGEVDPRLNVEPSGFDAVPEEKIGVEPPVFHTVDPIVLGLPVDPGYEPFSHRPKKP